MRLNRHVFCEQFGTMKLEGIRAWVSETEIYSKKIIESDMAADEKLLCAEHLKRVADLISQAVTASLSEGTSLLDGREFPRG